MKFCFFRQSPKDKKAVANCQNTLVVGHVPAKLSVLFCQLLSRTCNKGTVKVSGAVVNRGAGYGMEVPCKYRLYGTRAYVERVQKIIRENNLLYYTLT